MSRVIKSPGDIRLEISCPRWSCPVKGLQQEGIQQNRELGVLAGIKKKKGDHFPMGEGPAVAAGFCSGILIAINHDQCS